MAMADACHLPFVFASPQLLMLFTTLLLPMQISLLIFFAIHHYHTFLQKLNNVSNY